MAKIPTELYVCVPKRSARGTILYTNARINLTRKDNGEGIAKWVYEYMDGVNINRHYTKEGTGFTGPTDINPKTEGLHPYYVAFPGDAEFLPCKSEEIILKCDPNLDRTYIVMEVAPISGDAPLTIRVTGNVYILTPTAKKLPEYSLPLDLMLFDYDPACTKQLQPVKTVMMNPDGTFTMEYTFTKLGTYRIFVNFLGDNKYASAWSNNGRTTTIEVAGGGLPLSFEETITIDVKVSKTIKRILSETEPTAPEGYERAPEYDLDFGIAGKDWAFVKKTS